MSHAFPTAPNAEPGMSLRDYFAAQALTGVLSAATSWRSHTVHEAAAFAYELADAMLEVGVVATPAPAEEK